MRKYAVIGNCVTNGLARCVEFFDPGALVSAIHVWNIQQRYGSPDQMYSDLSSFDVVFLLDFDDELSFWGISDPKRFAESVPSSVIYPKIVFTGYHPDQVYAFDRRTRRSVDSPLTDCHSAIALYGYLKGFGFEDIRKLYNNAVFERLGYFKTWDAAAKELLSNETARAFNLDKYLLSWTREGCFMHNIIHPKINVLADIAREMMTKAGCRPRWNFINSYVQDELKTGPVWPVYPEIGQLFNVKGEYIFKKLGVESSPGNSLYFGLDEFLRECLDKYVNYPREQIQSDRVENWIRESFL